MDENPNKIRDFILEHVETNSSNITALVAENFGFSRQRANTYLAREVKRGLLIKTGRTQGTRYFLANGERIAFDTKIKTGVGEDQIWSKHIKPFLLRFPDNVRGICNYGFTEIFNNALDHSNGTNIFTEVEIKDSKITINVLDNGIGIFQKIQDALGLISPRESILHLSKGKFTTDPANHTGLGIFFSSRMFDSFSIMSDHLFYLFEGEDWILSHEKKQSPGKGTLVTMEISIDSKKTKKEIHDKYADLEVGFNKTIVSVALSADPNDPHVSRSQAKRLVMGLEKFTHVILNFKDVHSVGQAFVDEIFRVFQNEYPHIKIDYINADPDVQAMIRTGIAESKR